MKQKVWPGEAKGVAGWGQRSGDGAWFRMVRTRVRTRGEVGEVEAVSWLEAIGAMSVCICDTFVRT